MEAKEAAEAIRDKINPGLGEIIARDEKFVREVVKELGIADTPVNRVQALIVLQGLDIATRQEYPKVKYRAVEGKAEGVTVYKASDEEALGIGWFDSPAEALAPPAKDAKASKGGA